MKTTKKIIVAVLAAAFVLTISVSGIYAFLNAKTTEVKNTFVAGTLFSEGGGIVLDESKAIATAGTPGLYTLDPDVRVLTNEYTVVPGTNLPKDPTVTVSKLEIASYLFVEIVSSMPDCITWAADADNWTKLSGVTGENGGDIYAYTGNVLTPNIGTDEAPGSPYTFGIIDNNELVVSNEVAIPETECALSFYAYICQSAGFSTASLAWTGVFASENP